MTPWQPSRRSKGIGERLRFVREQKGWSQRELARRAGLSSTAISQFESGDRGNPSLKTIAALERELGRSLREPGAPNEIVERAIEEYLASRDALPDAASDLEALRAQLELLHERTFSPFAVKGVHMAVRSEAEYRKHKESKPTTRKKGRRDE